MHHETTRRMHRGRPIKQETDTSVFSCMCGGRAFEARPEVAGTCRPPCVFRTVAADTPPGRLMIHSTNNYNYNYKRGRAWVVTILSFS